MIYHLLIEKLYTKCKFNSILLYCLLTRTIQFIGLRYVQKYYTYIIENHEYIYQIPAVRDNVTITYFNFQKPNFHVETTY